MKISNFTSEQLKDISKLTEKAIAEALQKERERLREGVQEAADSWSAMPGPSAEYRVLKTLLRYL